MKNILVPSDFSENAWNATRYAIELFKSQDCVFHIVNTYTPAIANSRFMASSLGGKVVADGERTRSENGLELVLERIKNTCNYSNHSFKTYSSFRLLVDEVKEITIEQKIDLIVTGTKGASGVDEVFMGSNTVRLIKAVKNCPILAIPQFFGFEKPKEIAFATDFNRFYTTSELKPLIDLARVFNATIRIVHVQYEIKALTELQQFNLGMLRKYLHNIEHYVHTVSELNSVSKTLEVFSKELDIHLLAMLNYQHSYVEKLTREPVIKRMAFHAKIPLLIIPELGMATPSNQKIVKEKLILG